MDVTILIASHGDGQWRDRGASCYDYHNEHFDVPIVWHHEPDGSIASTRNHCVEIADRHGVGTGWLCFVDADDWLEPGYLDAMEATECPDPHLRAPAVRYGPGSDPMVFRDRNINTINPCVIGTLIDRDMFDQAGRFWEERAWEDWSLFRRAWLLGARIVHVEEAVYRANSTPGGRNSTVTRPQQLHAEIISSHRRWLKGRT